MYYALLPFIFIILTYLPFYSKQLKATCVHLFLLLYEVHFPRSLLSVSSTAYIAEKVVITYSIMQQEMSLELF